jgi:hypothetical protein
MKKLFALVAVLLLMFLTTAGCINLDLANEFLVPKKDEVVVFQWSTYNFNDSFESSTTAPLEIYDEEFEVEVKPQTKAMRINIAIVMRTIQEIWESLPEELKDILEEWAERLFEFTDQRYIEITIKMPNGNEIYNERFNQSTNLELDLISTPMEGIWIVRVEANGAGYRYTEGDLEYHDSFSINVILHEVKK